LDQNSALIGAWRFYDQALDLLETRPKADYQFDPRTRPWFEQAIVQPDAVMIKPYIFFTTGQAGVTLAQRGIAGKAVIGMDVAIDDLNHALTDLRITQSSEVAVVGGDGTVIAYPDTQRLRRPNGTAEMRLPHIDELGAPSLAYLFHTPPKGNTPLLYQVDGRDRK